MVKLLEELYSPETMKKLDEYCAKNIAKLKAFRNRNVDLFENDKSHDGFVEDVKSAYDLNLSAAQVLLDIKSCGEWIRVCEMLRSIHDNHPDFYNRIIYILHRSGVFEGIR